MKTKIRKSKRRSKRTSHQSPQSSQLPSRVKEEKPARQGRRSSAEEAFAIEMMQKLNGQVALINEEIENLIRKGRINARRNPPTRPSGSVSKYDCEKHLPKVVLAMANGVTYNELCLELGISTSVLNTWRDEHPEFQEAINFGEELAQAWWLRKARLNIHNPLFNNQLFTLNMQNRFGWSKKLEGNINQSVTKQTTLNMNLNLRKVEDEDLEQVLEILTEAETVDPGIDAGSEVRALLSEAL